MRVVSEQAEFLTSRSFNSWVRCSICRAPVSEAGGCRFDSCRACKSRTAWCGSFSPGESLPPSLASGSRHYRSIPAGPVENAKPRSELCPCEASCLQARREPTELPLLVQGKPALSDGLQVGHWPGAFDVHADPTPRGHGIQADTLRMRGVELQAGPAEARRQLGLAARPIPEVQHLRLHPRHAPRIVRRAARLTRKRIASGIGTHCSFVSLTS